MLYKAFLKIFPIWLPCLCKLLSVTYSFINKVATSLSIQNSLVYINKICMYILFLYYFLTFSICSSLIKIWCPFSPGQKIVSNSLNPHALVNVTNHYVSRPRLFFVRRRTSKASPFAGRWKGVCRGKEGSRKY